MRTHAVFAQPSVGSHGTVRPTWSPRSQRLEMRGRGSIRARAGSSCQEGKAARWTRRSLMYILPGMAGLAGLPSFAAGFEGGDAISSATLGKTASGTPDPQQYMDEPDGFAITLPPGWQQRVGQLAGVNNRLSNSAGLKRAISWHPDGNLNVNVSVTVSPLAADFTSITSFGRPEEFGQALVNQMDRSFLTRAGALGRGASRREQTAQLVSARQAGPSYLVSYTVSPVDLAPRAVMSVVTPGSHKRRSRLYTLNLSAPAEERERWEPVFSGVLQSFSVPRA
ncbi:CGLD14 [Auxenochlorella protothecoides x Auxenochlorella symbiontica]